jgi:hypothetical protein
MPSVTVEGAVQEVDADLDRPTARPTYGATS